VNQIADEDPKTPTRNLYLFTDGTRAAWEGPQAEALRRLGPEAAKRYRVTHLNMTEGKAQWNQAVLAVRPAANLVTTRFESDLLASVVGYGTAPGDASLQWALDGQPLGPAKTVRPETRTDVPESAKLLPSR
jgi:hypothetical protein